MFLEIDELKTVLYKYQLDEITEQDDDIAYMAICAAIDEVKSYLKRNNKKDWSDGRIVYDANAVFNATGTDRSAIILEMTKNVAFYNVVRLCNIDIVYEQAKERYDRAIDWLKKLNKGDVTLDLPALNQEQTTVAPFRFSSRKKFNHEH